jgi:hypothetical protein
MRRQNMEIFAQAVLVAALFLGAVLLALLIGVNLEAPAKGPESRIEASR